MKRRGILLLTSVISLFVALGLGAYIYELGLIADGSVENVALPLWAVVLGGIAVTVSISCFIRWVMSRPESQSLKQ